MRFGKDEKKTVVHFKFMEIQLSLSICYWLTCYANSWSTNRTQIWMTWDSLLVECYHYLIWSYIFFPVKVMAKIFNFNLNAVPIHQFCLSSPQRKRQIHINLVFFFWCQPPSNPSCQLWLTQSLKSYTKDKRFMQTHSAQSRKKCMLWHP